MKSARCIRTQSTAILLTFLSASMARGAESERGLRISTMLARGEKVFPGYPVLFRVSVSSALSALDVVPGPPLSFSVNGKRLPSLWFGEVSYIGRSSDPASGQHAQIWLLWLQQPGLGSPPPLSKPGEYTVSVTHGASRTTAGTTVSVEPVPESEAAAFQDYAALFSESQGSLLWPRYQFRAACDELTKEMRADLRKFIAKHPGSRYAFLAEMPLLYDDARRAIESWREVKDMPEQQRVQQAQALLTRCRKVYEGTDCVQFRAYALYQAGFIHTVLGRRPLALAIWEKWEREFPTSAVVIEAQSDRDYSEELLAEIKAAVESVDESLIFGPLPGTELIPKRVVNEERGTDRSPWLLVLTISAVMLAVVLAIVVLHRRGGTL
jgi:hypothetical protein